MSDKHLSGEEKRRLLKEQFKKDLMQRKEFLGKVKGLRQTQRINAALSNMTPEDDTDEWIQKLNEESAFAEAKADLAMDDTLSAGTEDGQPSQETEAEMEKILAVSLVEEMKAQMLEESKIGRSEEYVGDEQIESETEPPKPGRKTLGDIER